MISKPNVTTIPLILEAADFKGLQSLMLENNARYKAFHKYDIVPPVFPDDTWKALYYRDIESLIILKKQNV